MQIIETRRPAPVAPTGSRKQRSNGVVKVAVGHGATSYYPTGPKPPKAPRTARTIIAGAGKNQRKGPARKNKGYTAKVKNSFKTSMLMMDMAPIIERAKRSDVHITFLTFKYAPSVITTEADTHSNIETVIKAGREVVGPEFAYWWNIESLKTGQAHWNLTSALTNYEAYVLRKAFFKLSGWGKDTRLQEAAHIRTPSSFEEKTRSAAELLEHVLNYTTLFGSTPKALKKAHQYFTPTGWAETGTGAMWGKSRNLKPAEEVTLVIHNMRQRKGIDKYMQRRLGIEASPVVWRYAATGELSDVYDTSAFSPDRHGGSRYCAKITPDMLRDMQAIVAYFA